MQPHMTIEQARALFSYRQSDGALIWAQPPSKKIRSGAVAGNACGSCIQVMFRRKNYKAHRIIWALVHGEWPTGDVDHIDGNPLNNRLENLRAVSHRINMENRVRPQVNGASGFLGVSYDKSRGKWVAKLQVSGRTMNLGRFDDPESAHEAYINAKRVLHAGCTL